MNAGRLFSKAIGATVFALTLSSSAFGYYHFVRFPSKSGPFSPIYEKFDLNALPGRTLRYYVAETGPDKISATDSFTSVVSQIKLAAKVWNDVDSSELRLVFGGLINPSTPQTSPGIDIVFDDEIPPGVIAQAGPITYDYSSLPSAATFVPVVRSKLQLRKDLTRYPVSGGTYENFETFDEMFFGTLVHEFGHTLGLQHSFTSGAMATRATRGTSKAKPLTGDDIAGLSVLYPTESFLRSTGTIRGRVVSGTTGINMASVVAISPNGPAISTLTNPDGTYRIDGIPSGITYYVYVHPLPTPDALDPLPGGIFQPWDSLNARGGRITTRDLFSTQFHPLTFVVRSGQSVESVDFNVQRRSSLPINVVQTYGFVGQVAVKPAPVNGQNAAGTVYAYGLAGPDGNPVQGLTVRVLGGSDAIPGSIRRYAAQYIQFDVMPPYGDGPRHIIFSAGGDQYVLPAAFNLIQRAAPTVDTVTAASTANGTPAALVTGKNLAADSRILFDGLQSSIIKTNADGSMLVSLPPAPGGHRARVVALNSDGQSSLFSQGTGATQYTYEPGETGIFALSVNAVPAGSELLIEVNGTGTNFVDGQTTIGFGSSDIAVRRVWVVSPTKLYANISIVPHSPIASTTVTVNSGLQLFSAPLAFEIQSLNPRQLSINYASVRNVVSGGAGVTAGSTASVSVNNLSAQAGVTATLNGTEVKVTGVSGNVVSIEIPADTPTGPAVLRIATAEGSATYPLGINIDAPPPVIQSALAGVSGTLDASRYVSPHDLMTLVVDNLFEPQSGGDVKVLVGDVEHAPIAVLKASSGATQVQIILSGTVPQGNDVPVKVAVQTRVSDSFPINIKPN